MTDNPLSPKITKPGLEQYIDRSQMNGNHLWMIYLPEDVAATCSAGLGEGALQWEDSAIGRKAAADSGLAPFSLHSQ